MAGTIPEILGLRLLQASVLLWLSSCLASGEEASQIEEPICLGFIETKLFDAWRQIANENGRPQKNIEGIAFQEIPLPASDGTQLYGYRAFAEQADPKNQPAVLIVPGNAMLADQLYEFAGYFAAHGMSAYVFDYRGYGGSGGTPYAKALIDDYKSILSSMADEGHPKIDIYAMSFGGIVTLATLKNGKEISALVLDGVPSELPWYAFCPSWLDPENNIQYAPEHTLVISGSDDPVIPPGDMAGLRQKARERGMDERLLENFSHPGLDETQKKQERLGIVREFLSRR
jgi:dienelactone hydrolase